MGWTEAGDQDLSTYSAVYNVWQEMHRERDGDGDAINTAPPPIEWLQRSDDRLRAKGYVVN